MKYSFLLFDADNTLFDFTQGARVAFERALNAFGIACEEGDYALYSSINDSLWKRYERGEIEKSRIYSDRFVLYSEKVRKPLPAEAVNAVYKKALGEQAILIEGAEALLTDLKAAGYLLYLITNGDAAVQTSRITRSPLKYLFDGIFISEEIGHAKPSPLFFDAVAESIPGFDKRRALVIGDSETSDIRGANNAGIDCCHVAFDQKPLSEAVHAEYEVASLNDLRPILLPKHNDSGGLKPCTLKK